MGGMMRAMMQNPALMQQAQAAMQNPAMMQMAQNMMQNLDDAKCDEYAWWWWWWWGWGGTRWDARPVCTGRDDGWRRCRNPGAPAAGGMPGLSGLMAAMGGAGANRAPW